MRAGVRVVLEVNGFVQVYNLAPLLSNTFICPECISPGLSPQQVEHVSRSMPFRVTSQVGPPK